MDPAITVSQLQIPRRKPRLQYLYPSLFYKAPSYEFEAEPEPTIWAGDSVQPTSWASVDSADPTAWRDCAGMEEDV